MASLNVQVVDKNQRPLAGKKVSVRSFIGPLRDPLDWDEYTNEDGVAIYFFIDPGPKEIYVDGVLKLEVEIGETAPENIVLNA